MAKLSKEEQAAFDELQAKLDEPDEPERSHSRVENVNVTIDLADETQVKRAVRSGLLPASYLEDDEPGDEGDPEPDAAPNRKMDTRYS